MLTFTTLASGSSGNAALVSCGDTHVLLDAGISARRITTGLKSLGVDPADFEIMAENAMKDATAATNPRKATKDQIIAIFQKAGLLFAPAKAANAGGVAVSALEMSQNSMRYSWTFEEVDAKLQGIMVNMFHNINNAAKEYGMEGNLVAGANLAGFKKVSEAMIAQGVV